MSWHRYRMAASLAVLATTFMGCASARRPPALEAPGQADVQGVIAAVLASWSKADIGCVAPAIEGVTLADTVTSLDRVSYRPPIDPTKDMWQKLVEYLSNWVSPDHPNPDLPAEQASELARLASEAAMQPQPQRHYRVEASFAAGMDLDHAQCAMRIREPVFVRGTAFVDSAMYTSFGGKGIMYALRKSGGAWRPIASRISFRTIA